MISETLQDDAALYVIGAMTEKERAKFDLILEFDEDLRRFFADVSEVCAALARSFGAPASPSAGLKEKVMARVASIHQKTSPDGFVMSGPDGLVRWVNPAFTAMCGYSLEELKGKSLGPILQGEKTNRETAARMRRSVQEHLPCRETILNYHKNGQPYWVEIAITPIFDDGGELQWLVAREHELVGHATA